MYLETFKPSEFSQRSADGSFAFISYASNRPNLSQSSQGSETPKAQATFKKWLNMTQDHLEELERGLINKVGT